MDTLKEDETALPQWPTFEEEARKVAEQEEKAANRKMQEQALASLDQLGRRLEKLEGQLARLAEDQEEKGKL